MRQRVRPSRKDSQSRRRRAMARTTTGSPRCATTSVSGCSHSTRLASTVSHRARRSASVGAAEARPSTSGTRKSRMAAAGMTGEMVLRSRASSSTSERYTSPRGMSCDGVQVPGAASRASAVLSSAVSAMPATSRASAETRTAVRSWRSASSRPKGTCALLVATAAGAGAGACAMASAAGASAPSRRSRWRLRASSREAAAPSSVTPSARTACTCVGPSASEARVASRSVPAPPSRASATSPRSSLPR